MDLVPFMKIGNHTDSKGRPFKADEAVLNKIIEMNKGREFPYAIGHPEMDSPAYGWGNGIERVGDKLYAKTKTMVAEFKEWVNKGLWKTISVALNPNMTIRHIGFLGATPPAIEGLTAEFKAGETDLVFEFSKFDENLNQEKEEHVMKKLFALLGLTETATEDDAIAAVNTIKTSAGTIVANKAVLGVLELKPEATETEVVGQITLMKQSHAAVIDLRKDNAKLEKEIKDRDADDVVRFARSKGKITREQESWALEYAKDDIDGFKNFINKAPVVLDTELTDKGGHAFVSPGSDVDMDTVQSIASKALEFQAAAEKSGRVVTISEAVNSVVKKKR